MSPSESWRTAWLCLGLACAACAPAGDGGDPTEPLLPQADGAVDAPDSGPPDGMTPPDGIAPPADARAPDPGPPGPDDVPRFAFPIAPEDRRLIHPGLFFGVDHDPADGDAIECLAYDGRRFPFCYDGHDGSDFVLDGGFVTMDAGSARVVAAAGGVVVEAVDGHYDRCSGDLQMFEPSCDGHPIRANKIVIEHPNGWRSRYLHLMRGSVAVAVGDRVDCGAPLARVGSSGRSFTPHLHFEVRDPANRAVDPFSGEITGPETLWVEQRSGDGLPGPDCDPSWGPAR